MGKDVMDEAATSTRFSDSVTPTHYCIPAARCVVSTANKRSKTTPCQLTHRASSEGICLLPGMRVVHF